MPITLSCLSQHPLSLQVCERWRRGISVLHSVGCLAEVRRLRRDTSGAMQAVARGAQRVQIVSIAGEALCVQMKKSHELKH